MGKKIVVLGGGTGLSVILRGLKKKTNNITAIVSVADDGGSSGVLREDLGMLPPGDIRSCIVALSNTEPIFERLFNYRFEAGRLEGQSLGNLMIAAMEDLTGSFEEAIAMTSKIFAINGAVLPVTTERVHLKARLKNGRLVIGESRIPLEVLKSQSPIEVMELEPNNAKATPAALQAIREADAIIIGPGSLYTSVIPNLLIGGIEEAIKQSSAPKIYITNIMTQPGETDSYSALDHILAIERHAKEPYLTHVLVNNEVLDSETRKHYEESGSKQVLLSKKERAAIRQAPYEVVEASLIEVVKNYCRHDYDAITDKIFEILHFNSSENGV